MISYADYTCMWQLKCMSPGPKHAAKVWRKQWMKAVNCILQNSFAIVCLSLSITADAPKSADTLNTANLHTNSITVNYLNGLTAVISPPFLPPLLIAARGGPPLPPLPRYAIGPDVRDRQTSDVRQTIRGGGIITQ